MSGNAVLFAVAIGIGPRLTPRRRVALVGAALALGAAPAVLLGAPALLTDTTGLTGLAERLDEVGGRLEHGRVRGGGYRVLARGRVEPGAPT